MSLSYIFEFIFSTHIILICGFSLAVVVFFHMLNQKFTPAGTTAWLLAIVFMPYVAVPIYFMLGSRKLQKIIKHKEKISFLLEKAIPKNEANAIDVVIRSYGLPGATKGNETRLCRTGDEALAGLLEVIEQAKERIYMTSYIFKCDKKSTIVADALAKKAAAGIEVKVLLDGIGTLIFPRRSLKPLMEAGGQVAMFRQLFKFGSGGRTNLRNHRKMTIADDRIAWAGGANIGEEYFSSDPRVWQDLSFVIKGPEVTAYALIFQSDWHFVTGASMPPVGTPKEIEGGEKIQVVPSGPDVSEDPLFTSLMQLCFQAKKRLWIVTPYYVPNETLNLAIRTAARRGVDVKVFVPKKSDNKIVDAARYYYLRAIEAAGGQVLFFERCMLHAKCIVKDDDLAMIGSANMDSRSLLFNFETASYFYEGPTVANTATWVESLIDDCSEGCPEPNFSSNLKEGLVKVISPLL